MKTIKDIYNCLVIGLLLLNFLCESNWISSKNIIIFSLQINYEIAQIMFSHRNSVYVWSQCTFLFDTYMKKIQTKHRWKDG